MDASGNMTLAKTYEPYGQVLNSAGSASTVNGFTGEWTDQTGLVYLRFKCYDPFLTILDGCAVFVLPETDQITINTTYILCSRACWR